MSPINADLIDLDIGSIAAFFRGATGTGKTIASCGKEFRPVYVFDTDQRMRSVIRYYKQLDGHCKGLEFDSYAMGMDFRILDQKMDSIMNDCPYKTIVVATLSSYIHLVLAHVVGFKAGAGKGKSVAGIQVADMEAYLVEDAAIIFELVGFLKQLQQRGINVILEAHLTPIEYKDMEGKSWTVQETLTKGKKAPAAIPGYFDEVYYFKKTYEGIVAGMGEASYKMFTSDSTVDCKSSRGIPNLTWTNKDFSELLMVEMKKPIIARPKSVL